MRKKEWEQNKSERQDEVKWETMSDVLEFIMKIGMLDSQLEPGSVVANAKYEYCLSEW